MSRSRTLDDRATFMVLLKEAERHDLRREALALLTTADGEQVIDWRAACARLNALLEPHRTQGPTIRRAGPSATHGIEVEEGDPDAEAAPDAGGTPRNGTH